MKMKKIIALVLCAILLVAGSVLGTIAYLSDSDAQVNTFSAGLVDIELDEAVVKADDNDDLVPDGEKRTSDEQDYELHPGQTVTKDPTITVAANSEDAYVAAKVVITCKGLDTLIGNEDGTLDITKLASGGLLGATDTCEIRQEVNTAGEQWTLYFFVNKAMAANEKVVLFTTLTIPAEYNNPQMAILNDMQMDISAYATQEAGFDSCVEAIVAAFPTAFAFAAA